MVISVILVVFLEEASDEMKALIADKFENTGIDELKAVGCEIRYEPGLNGDALRDAVVEFRPVILIVRSTKVTAEVVAATEELSLIIRAGAGYNTIDVAAASGRGVAVANCPGKNAVAVAELTLGLILALDRRIVDNVTDLRNGQWNKKEYSSARGLKGRTLGVIGTGEIGRSVIRRALAFDMKVIAYSRSLSDPLAEELGVVRCESPADVAERCDVLSIHVAASPETKGMINADVLNRLRPGSYLINTARADVLDYEAMLAAMKERNLRVGLDVYPGEPSVGQGEFVTSVVKAGGIVYGTHHIGASTDQAQSAIAAEAVRIAKVFATTGEVPNCVNIETHSPAKCQMVVRHYDKVGVLAGVLDLIRQADISVKEMSNTIYQGHEAAVAILRLDKCPSTEVVESIAAQKDNIIKVEVKPFECP